jgi:phosphoketolase
VAAASVVERLFPNEWRQRLLLTHMRAEVARGHLWPILGDGPRNAVLGYRNRGGTLDEAGMLFANSATWAHVLQAVAGLLDRPLGDFLGTDEAAAVQGTGDPRCLR